MLPWSLWAPVRRSLREAGASPSHLLNPSPAHSHLIPSSILSRSSRACVCIFYVSRLLHLYTLTYPGVPPCLRYYDPGVSVRPLLAFSAFLRPKIYPSQTAGVVESSLTIHIRIPSSPLAISSDRASFRYVFSTSQHLCERCPGCATVLYPIARLRAQAELPELRAQWSRVGSCSYRDIPRSAALALHVEAAPSGSSTCVPASSQCLPRYLARYHLNISVFSPIQNSRHLR